MPDQSLQRLRALRARAQEMLNSLSADLGPFCKNDGTFILKPNSSVSSREISPTTTCSCLMSLALSHEASSFYSDKRFGTTAQRVFLDTVESEWKISGLDVNNAFTTALVLRALGFLVEAEVFGTKTGNQVATDTVKLWGLNTSGATTRFSLKQIAQAISKNPKNFEIGAYAPSAAVIYWFVDGVRRASLPLTESNWRNLCSWASTEFNHQLSLVASDNDAMMDPVAMAMSACLCARLRTITQNGLLGAKSSDLAGLPSEVELERSIGYLFAKQTPSGIWNKYFPMFHYQTVGSNYCFTFELLEALLSEFTGPEYKVLDNSEFLDGLEKAVEWCENNRLKCTYNKKTFSGWNSGGSLESLRMSQPESWATAVVHMFLSEIVRVVSTRIQFELLKKYKVRLPKKAKKSGGLGENIGKLMDTQVFLSGKHESLRDLVINEIVKHRALPDRLIDSIEQKTRYSPIPESDKLSALLFGPPGTSKTEIIKAIADDLHWPLVELTPAIFVRESLAFVHARAEEIFDDLMDLSGVIIFFDEMDALVQTREGEANLDITSQFLTTTMLPMLSRLHNRRRVLFFMATNFQDRFDAAIKRAGRFDLLLCMGPPTLKEKYERLHLAYRLPRETAKTKRAGKLIEDYVRGNQSLIDAFELFTYGDFSAFLTGINSDASLIEDSLKSLGKDDFCDALREFSKNIYLKESELTDLKSELGKSTLSDLKEATITYAQVKEIYTEKNLPVPAVARYLCDWHQSKRQ